MKATGIIRRVDVLGRVVVPKEIRKAYKIDEGDPLEIFTEKDGIILRKYSPLASVSDESDDVCSSLSLTTGKTALICDKDCFISASGSGSSELLEKTISKRLREFIHSGQTLVCAFINGDAPIELIEGSTCGYFNQLVMPIKKGGDILGAVILADKNKENQTTGEDLSLCTLACELLSKRYK